MGKSKSAKGAAQPPAPFVLSPSWQFDGDDGKWSTFSISVGTPPQRFRVLPSTTGAETWIPISLGCDGYLANVADCGDLRGVEYFNGVASRGFETNASSTWDLIGTYDLATEQNLWGDSGNEGLYGLDTISLKKDTGEKEAQLTPQTIAGVVTANVWVGSLGMGTSPANFSIERENIPSLMESMKAQNTTPSLSYGYTAGASYAATPGSLIIGGYDQARFNPSNLSLPIGGFNNQNLPLAVESIVAENTLVGIRSILPSEKAIDVIIDSTVSQMWLPQGVCDVLALAFGLTYDFSSGLYLVNATVHQQLTQLSPTITFTIGSQGSTGANTNIQLPYAAFDLQAGMPLFNSSMNYFPMRVAANESQQVLGRAFLQEAYVFVDWERKNFTIGQAVHQNTTTNIVAVSPPIFASTPANLSTITIVGIVIGSCAVIALSALAAISIRKRRRRQQATPLASHELPSEPSSKIVRTHELDDTVAKHELVSTQISELHAEGMKHELADWSEQTSKRKDKWSI